MGNGDSSGYYFHVVSLFINHDAGDYTKTIDDYLKHYPRAADPRKDKFGVRKTALNRSYIKYTLGVGFMELPAFFAAHAFAKVSDRYEANGWTKPYIFAVHFSKVVYILLGFYLLIIILERFFSKSVVAITVFSTLFATNLFYHGIFLTLAHSFLFFDFSLLIYLTVIFYEKPSNVKIFLIGLTVGLIALTRVPEVISGLIPLLWGVTSLPKLRDRILFFIKNYQYSLLLIIGILIMFSPQLLYWRYVSGQFLFNSYQGENFNFAHPEILNGWFNYHNGWLIYTPIMVLGLTGLIFLYKKYPAPLLPAILFVLLNSWIHYSYYVWNYYPGMGSRPMIESYPLLAFGLAAFFAAAWKYVIPRFASILVVAFFVWLNIFQSWQMKEGIIWTERTSEAFYWEIFGRTTPTLNSLRAFDTGEAQADASDLQLVDTLYFTDFEQDTSAYVDSTTVYSGKYAYHNAVDEFSCDRKFPFKEHQFKAGDWIYVEVQAYRKQENMVRDRDALENLVVEFRNENGEFQKSGSIKIANFIDNKEYGIWHYGTPDVWGKAGFYMQVPENANPEWKLATYIWNSSHFHLYIDNYCIIHYRNQ